MPGLFYDYSVLTSWNECISVSVLCNLWWTFDDKAVYTVFTQSCWSSDSQSFLFGHLLLLHCSHLERVSDVLFTAVASPVLLKVPCDVSRRKFSSCLVVVSVCMFVCVVNGACMCPAIRVCCETRLLISRCPANILWLLQWMCSTCTSLLFANDLAIIRLWIGRILQFFIGSRC